MAPKKDFIVTLPEMDPMTEEHEAMRDAFISAVDFTDPLSRPPCYRDLSDEEVKIFAYKYLTARKWVLDDAVAMFRAAAAFRDTTGVDARDAYFPSPIPLRGFDEAALQKHFGMPDRPTNESVDRILEQIRPFYQSNFHKWDKCGHPVLIENTGRIRATEAVAALKKLAPPGKDLMQPAIDMHVFQNEVGRMLTRYQHAKLAATAAAAAAAEDKDALKDPLEATDTPSDDPAASPADKNGVSEVAPARPVTTYTVILDATGLSIRHLSTAAVDIVKKTSTLDHAYYPEAMHRLFIVNCPSIVVLAYNLIKGVLDVRVRAKITFCSPAETADVLKSVIDEDCLPAFLGGTCECEGGCVCMGDEAVAAAAMAATDDQTETLKVAAGAKEVRAFTLGPGDTLAWEFDSPSGHDIEFSVVVGGPKHVVPSGRTTSNADSYTAEGPGDEQVVITWDNGFSWVSSKVLRVRILHKKPSE